MRLTDLSQLRWPLGLSLVTGEYIMVARVVEKGIELEEERMVIISVRDLTTVNAPGSKTGSYELRFERPLFAWIRVKNGTGLKFLTFKSLHEWVTIGEIGSTK